MLRPQTRGFGLSLGDRACLALARQANLPALTGLRCSVFGMGPNRPRRRLHPERTGAGSREGSSTRYPSGASSSANSMTSASRSARPAWLNLPVSPYQHHNPCGQDTDRVHEEICELSAPVGNEPLRTLKRGAVGPGQSHGAGGRQLGTEENCENPACDDVPPGPIERANRSEHG